MLQIISACFGLLGFPVGTIISIVILVYLNKPGVKLLFSDTPVSSMTPEEQALVAATSASSSATTIILSGVAVLLLVFFLGIVAAIAVPGLLRARMSGNEAVAIGHLRGFTGAETSYALANRLLYDRPDCLLRPADCLSGYSGPAFLSEHPVQKSGYRFMFYPGAPPAPRPDGVSASSMTTFVITAAPISQSTGSRQFCADHTGEIRAAPLTAETVTAGPGVGPLDMAGSARSVNRDLPGPLVAAGRRIVVIVEAAGADGDQVAGLAALARLQQADGVDLRAVVVLGMRIRGHVVRADVHVDEGHARAWRDGDLRDADARGGDGDRGIAGRRGRRGRRSAAARGERQQREKGSSRRTPRL